MKQVVAYLLLTYGPKPRDNLLDHPAARQQVANIRHAVADREIEIQWLYDYARGHSDLGDLPILQNALPKIAELGSKLVMDDLGRLFRNIPLDRRSDFLSALRRSEGHIFGLRQASTLHDLSREKLLILLTGGAVWSSTMAATPRKLRSKESRQLQTEEASVASQISRKKSADAFATSIAKLRDELTALCGAPTLQQVAEAAKQRGLTSPRGKTVTATTVYRALKRAEANAAQKGRRTTAKRAMQKRKRSDER